MTPQEPKSGAWGPEQVGGITIRIEAEEDLSVRPARAPFHPPELPPGLTPTSPEVLAGITVCIEAEEDLTVRPGQPRFPPNLPTAPQPTQQEGDGGA